MIFKCLKVFPNIINGIDKYNFPSLINIILNHILNKQYAFIPMRIQFNNEIIYLRKKLCRHETELKFFLGNNGCKEGGLKTDVFYLIIVINQFIDLFDTSIIYVKSVVLLFSWYQVRYLDAAYSFALRHLYCVQCKRWSGGTACKV